MQRFWIYLAFFTISVLVSCNNTDTGIPESVFKKSYLSLMPEGEPENRYAFVPLHPSVIAWGGDPVHTKMNAEVFKKEIDEYKNIGLSLIASNVWMLTATDRYMHAHPEYQQAVCLDIAGEPIIPRWLDSEYQGVRPWWGCTNHPLFRSLVRQRASIGIEAGANMLHLDDHLGTCAAASHSGGCFCEYCVKGFNKWLEYNYEEERLADMGIHKLEDFNYKSFLHQEGFSTREEYMTGTYNNSIPYFDEFIAFQRYEAAAFVKELGDMADSIAGQHVPIGVNAYNLGPIQLATSHYADYFSNEVQHYDKEDLIPPFVYLLGSALDKPVFSTGTGEDWIRIMQKESPVRINRWIATAYAFGQYFMYSYNKWGFSEETGTQWYQIPMETYEPYFSFIHKHSFLFDQYKPYAVTAVLYDNASYRKGDYSSRSLVNNLHYMNIPVGLVATGDEWLKHSLSAKELESYTTLIIPETLELTGNLERTIAAFSENAQLLKYSNEIDLNKLIKSPIKVINAENVWTLPKTKTEKDGKTSVVIHLLNQNFDHDTEQMHPKIAVDLLVRKELTQAGKIKKLRYYSPDNKSIKLKYTSTDDGIIIRIPELDVWGILEIL
ncbi:hypothetical protein ACFLT1_02475 [Bacteroidota bacterium]